MIDGEWQLSYPGVSYSFGPASRPVMNATTPDIGDYALRVADTDNPRGDGIAFGTDYFGGRTISFDLRVGTPAMTEATVRAEVGKLAAIWQADTVRLVPGAVAEMRSQYRDSERISYGRPRRFAPNLTDARKRNATIVADFVASDKLFYSGTPMSRVIALIPVGGGGFTFPATFPLTTSANSSRATGISVAGEVPTWPVIEISGPITNPVVDFQGGPRFALTGTLNHDQIAVIDTRPWRRTVLINGVNAAGRVARNATRLSSAALPVGSYAVSFSGVSETGTAAVTITYREAFTTP